MIIALGIVLLILTGFIVGVLSRPTHKLPEFFFNGQVCVYVLYHDGRFEQLLPDGKTVVLRRLPISGYEETHYREVTKEHVCIQFIVDRKHRPVYKYSIKEGHWTTERTDYFNSTRFKYA